MGPSGRIGYILDYIALFGIGYASFRQVLYLGRAPHTKETLPDFIKVASGNPTSTCIPRVDGYSTDPRFWGVTLNVPLNFLNTQGYHR